MTPEACRDARLRLGWSVAQLAAAAQVSGNTIRRYEVGGTPKPFAHVVSALREALQGGGACIADGPRRSPQRLEIATAAADVAVKSSRA